MSRVKSMELGRLPQADITFPNADKGYNCPCCGSYCKRYYRKFNSNMAVALIFLHQRRKMGFIHLENTMIEAGLKRCGDASYLRHYGLIEPMDKERPDGSKRNGYYRITGRGILFAEDKMVVQQTFIIYNNKFDGFEGCAVGIKDVLGDKFNYNEMMGQDWKFYSA